ncbi:MAG: DUF4230 domain-containing protein [Acidobacteria bacterium]|nr:MAG: DUF4230 domain-containing protein [Acidobacteriota bacterium]REK00327.1 MAG: DUF4230 domain-containing protein [Acidobacteriota bacterium]
MTDRVELRQGIAPHLRVRYVSRGDSTARALLWSLLAVVLAVVISILGTRSYLERKAEEEYQQLRAEIEASFSRKLTIDPFEPRFETQSLLRDLVRSADAPRTARAPRDFVRAVWSVHAAALDYTGTQIGLSDQSMARALRSSQAAAQELADKYYAEFADTMATYQRQSDGFEFTRFEYSNAARAFSKSIGRYLCDSTLNALAASARGGATTAARILLPRPCSFLSTALVFPIVEELEANGLVMDFVESRDEIEEHLRQALIELAVAEDQFTVESTETFTKKFIFESTAEVEIRTRVRAKAGFDLEDFFRYEVIPARDLIRVTLPRAEILSVEATPTIVDMSRGVIVPLGKDRINTALSRTRQRIENRIERSDLTDVAERNAKVIVRQLVGPIARVPGAVYRVEVAFDRSTRQDPLKIRVLSE